MQMITSTTDLNTVLQIHNNKSQTKAVDATYIIKNRVEFIGNIYTDSIHKRICPKKIINNATSINTHL